MYNAADQYLGGHSTTSGFRVRREMCQFIAFLAGVLSIGCITCLGGHAALADGSNFDGEWLVEARDTQCGNGSWSFGFYVVGSKIDGSWGWFTGNGYAILTGNIDAVGNLKATTTVFGQGYSFAGNLNKGYGAWHIVGSRCEGDWRGYRVPSGD